MGRYIIIVSDYGYINGGASKVAIESAICLSQKGEQVLFFCAVGPVESSLTKNCIRVVCLHQNDLLENKSKITGALHGIWNMKAYFELKCLLEEYKYQEKTVHIHSWTKALTSSVFLACKKNKIVPFVTLHDYFSICPNGALYNYKKNTKCKYQPMSCRCILCNCDSRNYIIKIWRVLRQFVQNVFICNEENLNFCFVSFFSEKKIFPYLKSDNWFYLPNPIKPFNKTEDVSKSNFVFIGRLSPEKGADLFCEAIRQVGLRGIVVGDGEEKTKLETKYEEIVFLGWKTKSEISKILNTAIAIVITSKTYETDGLVVHEALGAGIPCIIPNECAASELVIEEENGWHFNCSDINSLSEVLLKAVNRRLEIERSKELTLEEHCELLVELYSENQLNDKSK